MAGSGGGPTERFASTLTDLMTSLAVIFVLLLVVFLKNSQEKPSQSKQLVKSQISEIVKDQDLKVTLSPDDPLSVIVSVAEDKLRFPLNGHSVGVEGAKFLGDFFVPFSRKVCAEPLRSQLDSLVIEGHTDTSGEMRPEGIHRNIELSQQRSFAVLAQALKSIRSDPGLYECLLKLTSATGRGSRSPIVRFGAYQAALSRRVEIKIRVKSNEQRFRSLVTEQQAILEERRSSGSVSEASPSATTSLPSVPTALPLPPSGASVLRPTGP